METDSYNKPWECDRVKKERFAKFVDSILREMDARGFPVGSETTLTLELITNILYVWDDRTAEECSIPKEEISVLSDSDHAYNVFARLLDKYPDKQVTLNREFLADGVMEASDEVFLEEFYQDHLDMPKSPEQNDCLIGECKEARLVELGNQAVTLSSRAGDHQTALKLLAYVQEHDDAYLSLLHLQRAGVFEDMGKLGAAIAELRNAVECEIKRHGLALPRELHPIARLELEAGRVGESLSAIGECLSCIEKWSRLPLRESFYVLKSESGSRQISVKSHILALKGIITLVEKIDAMPEFTHQLEEIKLRIVEVRKVIEEHARSRGE